jgi:hypothetical protein
VLLPSRSKQFQFYGVRDRLLRFKLHHPSRRSGRPLRTERIGPIELRLNNDEGPFRGSISLDSGDLRRCRHNTQAVARLGVDDGRYSMLLGRLIEIDIAVVEIEIA